MSFLYLNLFIFCVTLQFLKEYSVNLIIDIGNTSAKLAVFEQGEMKDILRCSNQSLQGLEAFCNRYPIRKGIICSVVSLTEVIRQAIHNLPFPVMEFTYQTPIPVKNLYKTPETLGMDRLAAVVAAQAMKPSCPILVIDAGTCITYDFMDEFGNYQGGNISPGLEMRFNALHHFTSKLPKISAEGETPPYGQTTETAIRAGVMRGIEFEIKGYISELQKNYPSLFVFLTGGNGFSFDTNLKSTIFADGLLVLKGLNRILEYND